MPGECARTAMWDLAEGDAGLSRSLANPRQQPFEPEIYAVRPGAPPPRSTRGGHPPLGDDPIVGGEQGLFPGIHDNTPSYLHEQVVAPGPTDPGAEEVPAEE